MSNLPQLEAIEAVTAAGWIRGIGNNQFDPETPVTRVALAVIMGTWLKQAYPYSSSAPSPTGYSDVSAQHWAYNAIVSVQPLNTLPVSTDKFTTSFHNID
ncbi:S-layer homology domain-containing protein [Paenibacillus wenxiniae]|uniref:S-layer homology domain-containing protein n=1 Tax=Paenibacillus wenxiniae TaxID=1636843 RepID=A0ABW4RKA3_9BACL